MKKLNFTKKSSIAVCAMLAVVFSGCSNNTNEQVKAEPKEEHEDLLLETAHCRYYCLGRNPYSVCKMVACECDSGFACDASVSW